MIEINKQTRKIYKLETKSYTALESETEDVMVAQVNLHERSTEHKVTKSCCVIY